MSAHPDSRRFLLDTNVLSEAMKQHADPHVLAFLQSLDFNRTFISTISVTELLHGIEKLPDGHRIRQPHSAVRPARRPQLRRNTGDARARRQADRFCGCADRGNRQGQRLHGRHPQYQGFRRRGRTPRQSMGRIAASPLRHRPRLPHSSTTRASAPALYRPHASAPDSLPAFCYRKRASAVTKYGRAITKPVAGPGKHTLLLTTCDLDRFSTVVSERGRRKAW